MILLNFYGKIQPTIISKKLGVGISNPASDWVQGLQDDFEEEIIVHKHRIEALNKIGHDMSTFSDKYDLGKIVENLGWHEDGKKDGQIIAEHLVEMLVLDFDNSLLQLKNTNLDSPTCEMQYAKKFIILCQRICSATINNSTLAKYMPFITYDSDELNSIPLMINYLGTYIKASSSRDNKNTEKVINCLQEMGQMIDNFILSEEDFWLFDYIVDALSDIHEQSAYHIFKVMSLIEMLIIKPTSNGKTRGEIEKKLLPFLPQRIDQTKQQLFSEILRKLRNKIGHGDYMAVAILLEQYRQEFMQNFWYDEFEYSIDNWTYGNICWNIDETLNNILWFMFSDRGKWENLRNS